MREKIYCEKCKCEMKKVYLITQSSDNSIAKKMYSGILIKIFEGVFVCPKCKSKVAITLLE